MGSVEVSTVREVLEQLREDVVAELQRRKVKVPQEALVTGASERAVAAWVRLQNRSLAAVPRTVRESPELLMHDLGAGTRASVATIRSEFERGDNLTHRLSREFYKSGFNDFLFNTFGIHHMHLGVLGQGKDRTKQHTMSGGVHELLFVIVRREEAYFLDVLDHDVFDDAAMTKSLVQIAQRNWPSVLEQYVIQAEDADLSFEEAFKMAKSGFTVPFEVDGVIFASGNVLDGKVRRLKGPRGEDAGYSRSACTSTNVMRTTHHVLNAVANLVGAISRDANSLADQIESETGKRPTAFRLEVIEFGALIVIRDKSTGTEFMGDGRSGAYSWFRNASQNVPSNWTAVRPPPST